jgi:hypothetical protein
MLAEPEIKVYQISAGGVPELMDQWSAQGKENVTKALLTRISGPRLKIMTLKTDSSTEQELKEISALFDAVSKSIITHTFSTDNNPNLFPGKLQNFDYSVGSLESIMNSSGGDALLIVQGVGQVATAGKKTLNVLGSVTGVAVGALTGIVVLPKMEGSSLRMALVDRNGTILWYNIHGDSGSALLEPDSSAGFVDDTLEGFPRVDK